MKKICIGVLFFAGVMAFGSCSNASNDETDSKEIAKEQNEEKFDDSSIEDDTKFAVSAADGGMMEVKLGKLAVANAASAQVKKFGQMMIDDHSKASSELKALAASKNISLPDSLSEEKNEKYIDLAKKKGADFDKAYTEFMVEDHKEDIEAFRKQAENGRDSALKAWAAGKVATLEQHLKMAESARDAVKN